MRVTRRRLAVEEHLRPGQVAERLHVHVRTVHRWIELGRRTNGRCGIWPVIYPGRKVVLIPASSITRFLERKRG